MSQFHDLLRRLSYPTLPSKKRGKQARRRKKNYDPSEMAVSELDWDENAWWEYSTDVLEIRSGVIVPGGEIRGGTLKWFSITTVTSAGSGQFVGVPFQLSGDPQSDDRPTERQASWFAGERISTFEVSSKSAEQADESNPPTPEAVLSALQNQGEQSTLRKAVLAAETTRFDPQQVVEVLGLLRRYISGHRSTSDRDVMVPVTSAVRSYVALLPAAQLDEVAGLIDVPGLPEVFESEVAKMVVRKLTANPPNQDNPYPALADQLAGLADAYLHPRLLARPYCGATTMNSVLALALLRSSLLPTVYAKVEGLAAGWFLQQLGRRAEKLAGELATRYPVDRMTASRTALLRIADLGKV